MQFTGGKQRRLRPIYPRRLLRRSACTHRAQKTSSQTQQIEAIFFLSNRTALQRENLPAPTGISFLPSSLCQTDWLLVPWARGEGCEKSLLLDLALWSFCSFCNGGEKKNEKETCQPRVRKAARAINGYGRFNTQKKE